MERTNDRSREGWTLVVRPNGVLRLTAAQKRAFRRVVASWSTNSPAARDKLPVVDKA
jgi:hypothetical protein